MTRSTRLLLAALLVSLAYGGVTRWQVRRLTSDSARLSGEAATLVERSRVSDSTLAAVNARSLALVADTARLHAALRDSRRRGATLLAEANAALSVARSADVDTATIRATLDSLATSAIAATLAAQRADSLSAARIAKLEAQLLASVTAGETALADAHAACEAWLAREIARLTAERPTTLQRVARAASYVGLGYLAGKLDVP